MDLIIWFVVIILLNVWALPRWARFSRYLKHEKQSSAWYLALPGCLVLGWSLGKDLYSHILFPLPYWYTCLSIALALVGGFVAVCKSYLVEYRMLFGISNTTPAQEDVRLRFVDDLKTAGKMLGRQVTVDDEGRTLSDDNGILRSRLWYFRKAFFGYCIWTTAVAFVGGILTNVAVYLVTGCHNF